MEINEGGTDRILRVAIGVILVGLGIFAFSGWVGIVFDVVGAVLIVTGVIGFCPLYALVRIRTDDHHDDR